MGFLQISVFTCLASHAASFATTVLQALLPDCTSNFDSIVAPDSFPHKVYTVSWVKLVYPSSGLASAKDVAMMLAEPGDMNTLGVWQNISLQRGCPQYSAKIHKDMFYVFWNSFKVALDWAGRVTELIRAIPRWHGDAVNYDLEPFMREVFPYSKHNFVTHTFALTETGGESIALCIAGHDLQFSEQTDAIVGIALESGKVTKTADDDLYFSMFQKLGTFARDICGTRLKVPFYHGNPLVQQWHCNGVTRFTSSSGVIVLALDFLFLREVFLLRDPFTYSTASGGAAVVQRFGTPFAPKPCVTDHGSFGSRSVIGYKTPFGPFGIHGIAILCLHNVWYERSASGKETITTFANEVASDNRSHAVEFDVNLFERGIGNCSTTFPTNFKTGVFSFTADAQGGARPLGDGVWIGASGMAAIGMEIIDSGGESKTYYKHAILYDSFTFLQAEAQPLTQLVM